MRGSSTHAPMGAEADAWARCFNQNCYGACMRTRASACGKCACREHPPHARAPRRGALLFAFGIGNRPGGGDPLDALGIDGAKPPYDAPRNGGNAGVSDKDHCARYGGDHDWSGGEEATRLGCSGHVLGANSLEDAQDVDEERRQKEPEVQKRGRPTSGRSLYLIQLRVGRNSGAGAGRERRIRHRRTKHGLVGPKFSSRNSRSKVSSKFREGAGAYVAR